MKLIHHGGYTEQERESYKEIIFSNTIQSMRAIILSLPPQIESDVLPGDVADAVRGLWRDPSVREAVNRSREFQLNDSAVYYFGAIDRMADPRYNPNDQDILRSRVKTTGITETAFKIGELTYKLFDVGGQRSERKKWIHCFENVTALVFLVSLSEYDQMLYEDESVVCHDHPLCPVPPCSSMDRFHRTACKRHSLSLIQYATLGGSSRHPSYACLSAISQPSLPILLRFYSSTRSTCLPRSSPDHL